MLSVGMIFSTKKPLFHHSQTKSWDKSRQ